MKTSIYQDRYNTAKTWKVEQKNKTYYLSQYVNDAKFGSTVKMTKEQIKEIGIFGFELLSCVEPEPKTKFIFSTPKMNRSKVILAIDYKDAQKKARDYLCVKRLPNDYVLTQLSDNIANIMSVDIK